MPTTTESHWKKIARIYCERSTVHGFNELYYAPSWLWTTFWSIIIVGGIGITAYQIKAEVHQFAADRNLALISPVETGEGLYPDVAVCYMHWVHWLNWTKAQQLGFTKPPLLIAVSLLSNVVSSERFDVSKAKLELKRLMVANNFTKISQLLYTLAIDLPSTNLSTGFLIENPILFRRKRIDYKYQINILCYVTKSEQVKEYLRNASMNDGKESASISLFSFAMQDPRYDNSPCKDIVTEQEYNYAIYSWLLNEPAFDLSEKQAYESNFTNFAMPIWLFPDGHSEDHVRMLSEREAYRVQFNPSVHRRRNMYNNPCFPGLKTVTSNLSCVSGCLYKYDNEPTECSPFGHLVHIGEDILDNVCMGVVQFMDDLRLPTKKALKPDIRPPGNKFYPDKPFERESNQNNQTLVKLSLEKCLNQCPPECEQWTYSFSYSKLTVYRVPSRLLIKNTTNVDIEYPLEEDILMLIDAEGQTWYDFIGNVGGIIGIWIGASIISVLQFIYVLCCVDKNWWSKARIDPLGSKNGSTSSRIKITVNKNVTVSPAGS